MEVFLHSVWKRYVSCVGSFVGIHVLGTGAWTGILASSILELDFKESIGACFCGVLLADVDDAIFWTLVAAGFAGGMATGVSRKNRKEQYYE